MEREVFHALAVQHQDMIFRLAFGYLKSRADAEDVTQNVLLALYRSEKVYESEAHLKNWLVRVTVNECKKIWRAPWSKRENIDDYTESLICAEPACAELLPAVLRLDKRKRIILLLYYVEGYSVKEIAALLHIPVGTVGSRMAKAREELRNELKEEVNF